MFQAIAGPDFEKLKESLKMTSAFDWAAPLVISHIQSVREESQNFINQSYYVSSLLAGELKGLSQVSLFRLISSPYFCELLIIYRENPRPELEQQIVQALAAEIKATDAGSSVPVQPIWTIDGDIVLKESIKTLFPPVQTQCGIRINYQSIVHNTRKQGIGGYSLDMALKHKERIESAKLLIAKVSTPALSIIDLFTTTIQTRVNKNRPSVVNSSTHTSIGLIRCDNFHLLHGDLPEIVDMLVHESIHQYLHLFEEQCFPFVDETKINAKLVNERIFASPWSGKLLDLRSYTHAILVWYGLYYFWNQYISYNPNHAEISSSQAEEKLAEAKSGFIRVRSVLDNLVLARESLHPEYVKQVQYIETEIKELTAHRAG